jgi:hypothetical protein
MEEGDMFFLLFQKMDLYDTSMLELGKSSLSDERRQNSQGRRHVNNNVMMLMFYKR